MDFFATGAFQQLFSELDEPGMSGAECFDLDLFQPQQQQQQECYYADINFGYEPGGMDYCGIITLDKNNNSNSSNNNSINYDNLSNINICCNNSNSSEDQSLFFNFGDAESSELVSYAIGSSSSPPELSDWEQRLLDNFVEIPELIDILPERTPLCTDMCDDFLKESNNNLRLATPSSSADATSATTPLQLGHNAAGEKGYLCTFGTCEKVYAKPAHLKAHLRRHLGEKPYACNWPDCSWRFSRSDELARHRRSHSGVKPYKCDYCAKCFARSDHLTKHRKVHERRLLAATRSGKLLPNSPLPQSVYAVRPGRKRKNQL